MDVAQALSLLRCARPQAQPNSGFLLQLEAYREAHRRQAKFGDQDLLDFTDTLEYTFMQ